MNCTFDPTPCAGGMFHCPECGDMVIAGAPHPDYSLLENMPPLPPLPDAPETLYTDTGERWVFCGYSDSGLPTYAPAQPVLVVPDAPHANVTAAPLPAWAFATEGE